MPSISYSTDRAIRFITGTAVVLPLVLLLSVLLLVLPTVSSRYAAAQETSGRTLEATEAGDGEVSIDGAEVYAGDGCARAGDVVAGDCEEKGGDVRETTTPGAPSPGSTVPESTSQENTFPTGGTTGFESTSQEATSELTAPGETTSQGGGNLCPTEPASETLDATVERAVDGDTLQLAEEVGGTDQVRLIGVDAPELEGKDGAPEPQAEEAATFTAEALEGEEVLLEVGEEGTDEYGRLLAYVWTGGSAEEGFMGGLKRMAGAGRPELFNRVLLEEGYAEALTVEPNDLYARCFETAEQAPRDEETGAGGTSGGYSDTQYGEQTDPETTAEQTVSEKTTLEETVLQEETGEEQYLPDESAQESSPGSTSSGAEPPEEDLDQEPPEDESTNEPAGEEPAQYSTTESAPAEEQATLPIPRQATEMPEQQAANGPSGPRQAASPPSYAAAPDVPADSGVPLSSLPEREASETSVAVLPKTGGAGLPLLLGACCLLAGAAFSIAAKDCARPAQASSGGESDGRMEGSLEARGIRRG